MAFTVFFSKDAENDLHEIFAYIKQSGYPVNAANLLSLIRKTCADLSEIPERGRIVPELKRIGISDFRELIVKVYRIIYEIDASGVYIHSILDGRRDVQTVLWQRIIR